MDDPTPNIEINNGQGVQVGAGNVQHNHWSIVLGRELHWPLQVGYPPVRAGAFQDREGLTAAITEALDRHGAAVIRQVVASGDGGVGKTQLAAAIFAKARDAGTDLLVWVNASSRESTIATLARVRDEIDARPVADKSAQDKADDFLSWLGLTTRSWIIVLDDVSDPADLRGLWPSGRAGRVLATTRRRDLRPMNAAQVPVGVFTLAEATSYLEARLANAPVGKHPDAHDGLVELAQDLGCLPVALAQASAYILNAGITCNEYRRRFAARTSRLTDLFPVDAYADDYTHTVAGTWSLTIERADQLVPQGLARHALLLAAIVDPNGVPSLLWTTDASLRYLTAEATSGRGEGAAVTDVQANAALRNLHRFSLVTHDPSSPAVAVRTHALVQRAALESISPDRRGYVARVAADAIVEVWTAYEQNPEWAGVLRRNALTLRERHPDALWQPEGHPVLFMIGRSFGELGLVRDAVDYWASMTAEASRQLGPMHAQTFTCRHHQAYWQGASGDARGALAAFSTLLDDRLQLHGPDHPDTLATRHGVADWLGESGDAAGAAAMFRELLARRLRVLGPDHPDIFTTQHGLADWLGESGDVAGAAAVFEQLLEDRTRVLGDDHIDTLGTRHGLAYARGSLGDAEGAVVDFEHLQADRIRVIGADHPQTLTSHHDLADWRGAAGDVDGSIRDLLALLHRCLRILGPDHPHTLAARRALLNWSSDEAEAAKAVDGFAALLADERRVLGDEHPDTLTTKHMLAVWRGLKGEVPTAIAALERVVAERREFLGNDHPATVTSRYALAYWRAVGSDLDRALEELREVLSDRIRIMGNMHPETHESRLAVENWQAARPRPFPLRWSSQTHR